MFRMLKLSPPHGWRAVVWELGIVTVGVLIALAAQQLVENINWNQKVRTAERQLTREALTNFRFAAEAVAVSPCVDVQLAALKQRLLSSKATNAPAPVYTDNFQTFVVRQPSRPYALEIWQSLSADATTAHLDNWRQLAYAQHYTQVGNLAEMRPTSTAVAGRLMVLAEAVPIDDATRTSLIQEIEEQRLRTNMTRIVAGQVMASLRDLGVAPDGAAVDRYLRHESGTAKFCRTHAIPLADWRKKLAAEPITRPGSDD